MFTGITTDVGEVIAVEPRAEGLRRLKVACAYPRASIAIGASISHSGVCLTVVDRRGGQPHRHFRRCRRRDAAADHGRSLEAGHAAQPRTRAEGRRRARRAYRRGPCRRHRRACRARGPDRHGAADACARRSELMRFIATKGLGRARRRLADGQRGHGRHILGADHPAHAVGDHARRGQARRHAEPRNRPDGALCGAADGDEVRALVPAASSCYHAASQ